MKNLSIDMGSSAFKVVGNGKSIYYPAVVGTKTTENNREVKIGYDALPMVIFPTTKIVWPVLKGIIEGDTEELKILIDHGVKEIFGSDVDKREIRLATGLPLVAYDRRHKVKEILNGMGFGEVKLFRQNSGALTFAGKKTGIVVSLGHGTTEIMAFYEQEFVDGVSLKKAIDTVLDVLGPNQFIKHDKVKEMASKYSNKIPDYVDDIVNSIKKIKNGLNTQELEGEIPIIFTGGGNVVPEVLEMFKTKLGQTIIIPDSDESALFGIARGMLTMIEGSEPEATTTTTTTTTSETEKPIQSS